MNVLETIEYFKRRKISLMLLNLGNATDSSNSQLIASVLAACAQFERELMSERQCYAKGQLGAKAAIWAGLGRSGGPSVRLTAAPCR